MENLKILKMTRKDYEQIKDSLTLEFDDFWSPSILESELRGENKMYLVAKQKDQQIVGFAGMMFLDKTMEIMNLVTKKQNRGNGIGTLLLNKIIEIAENKNIKEIMLEVKESNLVARKLYEKAGFFKIGCRKNYYPGNQNAILMSKNVNNLQK